MYSETMRYFKHALLGIAQASIILALFGCSKLPDADAIPPGPLMAESIRFQFAIYYLPRYSSDPSPLLNKIISQKYNKFNIINDIKGSANGQYVYAHLLNNVKAEYAPPDISSLKYFGRGLTQAQAQAVQKSEQAYILNFGYPRSEVWSGLRAAYEIAESVARETGGLLWDEQTRELYTPDEWHKRRIASWQEAIPAISDHTTIHAYNAGEYVRAITLGMSKFGLPDVVIDDFSWSMNRSMGHLINLFCQAIAEGATITKHGEFDLDIRSIKNTKIRDSQIESLKPNATALALLSAKYGKAEEGDPDNRLISLAFSRYPGKDAHARQEKLLSSLFGWEDEVTYVKHNEELIAASNRAKALLPALQKAFAAGLAPGEFIQVKAPFAVPAGGQEWMWVEITSWQQDKIKGLLKNEPFNIPSLHGGQIVEIRQQDIFDYIRRYPDGKEEGNETGTIIQKMQLEKSR